MNQQNTIKYQEEYTVIAPVIESPPVQDKIQSQWWLRQEMQYVVLSILSDL